MFDLAFEKERMYNPDLKEEFLLMYENERTQKTVAYIFYKSKTTEEMLGKDLCEFNINELEEVLYNTSPLTRAVVQTNGRFISAYITWAIEKGLLASNINPLSTKSNEWYEQFVDKSKKLFFSQNELEEMEKELVNAADAVILRLLFEGAGGHELSEILNLTSDHIEMDNVLRLEDDREGERKLTFSEDCLRLVRAALKETEYQSKNGVAESFNPVAKLVDNDYVIKSVDRRLKNTQRANKHTVYRRIKVIKEYFDLQYLTVNSIQRSGMIKMAVDLFERDGKLETEQYYEVADRFDMKKYTSGNAEYHNISILKEFINRENILELYGIDIEG